MAKQKPKISQLTAAVLLMFFFISQLSPATGRALKEAFTGEDGNRIVDSDKNIRRDGPIVGAGKKTRVEFHATRKFGEDAAWLLAMLPKGRVPASGPSRKINKIND